MSARSPGRMRHRPACREDIPLICGLPQDEEELFFCFPRAVYPLSGEQLEQAMAQRADSTVVELDGVVVAFANFFRWSHGGSCAIGNVMVGTRARGHGVARYLIAQMIALARSKYQAREIEVSCFNHNTAGLLLYHSLGFQPHGLEERQDHQGRRVALVKMRLRPAV